MRMKCRNGERRIGKKRTEGRREESRKRRVRRRRKSGKGGGGGVRSREWRTCNTCGPPLVVIKIDLIIEWVIREPLPELVMRER